MAGLLLALPLACAAFTPLSETELGDVHAQDGLTTVLDSAAAGITADLLEWELDQPGVDAARLQLSGLSLQAVDSVGNAGGAVQATARFDVGSVAGQPAIALEAELSRSRLRIANLRHDGSATRSYGTLLLDGEQHVSLRATGGLLGPATDTYLKAEIVDGRVIYEPLWWGHPYLTQNRFNARLEMPGGRLGMEADGLRLSTVGTASPLVNILLDFDLLYKFPVHFPGEAYVVTANDRPLMHFGWLGSLKNVEMRLKPTGGWTNHNRLATTQGMSLSSSWDFVGRQEAITVHGSADHEYRWQLGEAAAGGADRSRVNFELGDWTTWGGNAHAHDFPLIALDVITAGRGPGGFCWGRSSDIASCASGSQSVNLPVGTIEGFSAEVNRTGDKAIALLVREGQLMAFSRKVRLLETDAAGVTTEPASYNWGLIYTLANLNANLFLYPGGSEGDVGGGSRQRGIMADVMLMSQTFADGCDTSVSNCTQGFNWNRGTHLMIADTDINRNGVTGEVRDAMGIGLVSSNILLLANDMRLWLKQIKKDGLGNDVHVGVNDDPNLSGIDLMSPRARLHFKAVFGGGVLPPVGSAGLETVQISLLNLNLEGLFNHRLSTADTASPHGRNFLGFSAALRLMNTNVANFSESIANDASDDGSFIAFSQPSDPTAELRLANATGDIAIVNGRIDLRGSTEDGDGKTRLRIANTVQIGAAAAARMNDAVIGSSLPAYTSGSSTAGRQLDIGRVEFNDRPLGRIVIPNAQMYTAITLKPQ